MRDAGVSLLFLSGNAVCWVTPLRASSDGRAEPHHVSRRPLRRHVQVRGAARERARAVPRARPGRGFADGRPKCRSGQRRRRLDHRQARPLDFRGHGHEERRPDPGLVGWEYHGDPPAIPGLEVVAEGTAWVRRRQAAAVARPPSIRDRRATSCSTPRPSSGHKASAIRRATRCPGRTGAARTAPTNASSGSRTTCYAERSAVSRSREPSGTRKCEEVFFAKTLWIATPTAVRSRSTY